MKKPLREALVILRGLTCSHRRMHECHRGCGHWECPDCGLDWDESWDGGR